MRKKEPKVIGAYFDVELAIWVQVYEKKKDPPNRLFSFGGGMLRSVQIANRMDGIASDKAMIAPWTQSKHTPRGLR